MPFGLAELDGRLGGGGLRSGALHEATEQTCSLADDATTTLFLVGVAGREALRVSGLVLWPQPGMVTSRRSATAAMSRWPGLYWTARSRDRRRACCS